MLINTCAADYPFCIGLVPTLAESPRNRQRSPKLDSAAVAAASFPLFLWPDSLPAELVQMTGANPESSQAQEVSSTSDDACLDWHKPSHFRLHPEAQGGPRGPMATRQHKGG